MTSKEGKKKRAEPTHPPRKRSWWKQDLAIILFFSLLLVTVAWIVTNRAPHRAHARTNSPRSDAHFGPTVANIAPATEAAPEGMVWIPGGEFSMGANDPPEMDEVGMKATWDARPIHRVYVDGFYMDQTDVTNAEFKKFVQATGYVTVAERTPRAEDYPSAPPANLVAGGVVF